MELGSDWPKDMKISWVFCTWTFYVIRTYIISMKFLISYYGRGPICKPLNESKTPYNFILEEFLFRLFDVFSEFSDSCFMLFPSKRIHDKAQSE